MLIKRTAMWLFAWAALALLAPRGLAQVPANSNLNYQTPTPSYENAGASFAEATPRSSRFFSPFHPMSFEPTAQPFAPAETSGYGNGPRAKIGYFANYERLFWSLAKPEGAAIGSTTPLSQFASNQFSPDGPTVDNSFIGASPGWGNRWEVGYVAPDNHGWMVGVLDHVSKIQYRESNSPKIDLDDPSGILDGFVSFVVTGSDPETKVILNVGKLPWAIGRIQMKSRLQLDGLELMHFYRAPRLHDGGYFELLYGARWLQITDTFTAATSGNGRNTESVNYSFFGFDPAIASFPQNILDETFWNLRASNNLIGPQIGGRWFSQRSRWITSFEARVLAAANFQNVSLRTDIGTNVNQGSYTNMLTNWRGLGSDTHQFSTTFSPVGELRLNVSYQVTQSVGLKLGYTGLVVGNVSRASNRIDYTGPNLISILPTGIHQLFFANGINFGVEINR